MVNTVESKPEELVQISPKRVVISAVAILYLVVTPVLTLFMLFGAAGVVNSCNGRCSFLVDLSLDLLFKFLPFVIVVSAVAALVAAYKNTEKSLHFGKIFIIVPPLFLVAALTLLFISQ